MLTLLLLFVLGCGALALAGMVVSGVVWLILLPIRILFKIVFGLIGGVLGLVGGLIGGIFGLLGALLGLVLAPIGLLLGALVLVVMAIAAVVALLTPLLPLAIVALAGWAIYRVFFQTPSVVSDL